MPGARLIQNGTVYGSYFPAILCWGQSGPGSLRTFDLSLPYPPHPNASLIGCYADT